MNNPSTKISNVANPNLQRLIAQGFPAVTIIDKRVPPDGIAHFKNAGNELNEIAVGVSAIEACELVGTIEPAWLFHLKVEKEQKSALKSRLQAVATPSQSAGHISSHFVRT